MLPLGGLAPPPLLGGELGGEVGWAGGGFTGVVVPGLAFWLLPPTMGETTGARIGIEGRGMGSLSSCGPRAWIVLSATGRPMRVLRTTRILINPS